MIDATFILVSPEKREKEIVTAVPPVGASFSFESHSSGIKIQGVVDRIEWRQYRNEKMPRVSVYIRREE